MAGSRIEEAHDENAWHACAASSLQHVGCDVEMQSAAGGVPSLQAISRHVIIRTLNVSNVIELRDFFQAVRGSLPPAHVAGVALSEAFNVAASSMYI